MANRLFGHQREHPQVLVIGFSQQDSDAIVGAFPGALRLWSLEDAHQSEWDLLIASGEFNGGIHPDLFVVAFGGTILCKPELPRGSTPAEVLVVRDLQDPVKGRTPLRSVATKFSSPDDVPAPFGDLVADDLVPLLEKERQHSLLLGYVQAGDEISAPSLEIPGVTPLIRGSDGAIYAGLFRNRGGKGWTLSLPDGASLRWILAAVSHFHTIDRRRFPGTLDWRNRAIDWLTPDEMEAARNWADAVDASKAAQAAEESAKEAFYKTREAAAGGPFRLLTAGDDDLAAAVRDALTDLGFIVRDMDNEWRADDRLEDLRVSPPENPGWIALVEVKGHLRSRGQAAELMNLTGRFARRFREAETREPDAFWYVLNSQMTTDPAARKEMFDTNEAELRAFASDSGLAIDTRYLFLLWRDMKLGRITPEDARQRLVGATGRFHYEQAPVAEDKASS